MKKCPACHGERLKKESLSVTVGGINIAELCHKSVAKALEFFENLEISDRDKLIGEQIIKEIKSRLGFLKVLDLNISPCHVLQVLSQAVRASV